MSAPAPLRLTVAVCTRRRPDQLRRALHSLAGQAPAPAEVLVVDNAPDDAPTRAAAADLAPLVRYISEPVPGLDFARNRALREATQPVLAFLDDDAVAAPDWARALASAFDDSRVGVCTGRVEALESATEAQRLFEANGGFARGTDRLRLPADARRRLHGFPAPLIAWAASVGSGCSMAVRVTAARALGGFDEALDLGAELPGGGDLDLLWRMLEAEHDVVYEPAALAWHEHRRELSAVAEQIAGHQRALVAWLTKAAARTRGATRLSVVAFLAWRLAKPGVRLVRRAAGADPLPARWLWRMWWECWRGVGAYRRGLMTARRRREMA
jgi:glycosyltransferase involved in cell wall biosynthesis